MSGDSSSSAVRESVVADAAIMHCVARGDADIYHQLVDRHLDGMVGLAQRMLNDHGEAEDVVQECFLKLWQQAPSWHPDALIRTWLFRVVHNACVDRLRRGQQKVVDQMPELIDSAANPLDTLLNKNRSEHIQEMLASLPERQRVAVTLLHHLGFSQVEGASIMGVGVEAFESLCARGRRTLRKRLLGKKGLI